MLAPIQTRFLGLFFLLFGRLLFAQTAPKLEISSKQAIQAQNLACLSVWAPIPPLTLPNVDTNRLIWGYKFAQSLYQGVQNATERADSTAYGRTIMEFYLFQAWKLGELRPDSSKERLVFELFAALHAFPKSLTSSFGSAQLPNPQPLTSNPQPPTPTNPPLTLAAVRKHLSDSSLLLGFYPTRYGYFGVGVSKQAIRVRFWADSFPNPTLLSQNFDPQKAFLAYQTYLQPFVDSNTRKILVLEDNFTRNIGFERLLTDTIEQASAQKRAYAIRKYRFSYQKSLADWFKHTNTTTYPVNYQLLGVSADSTNLFFAKLEELHRGYFVKGWGGIDSVFCSLLPDYGFVHLKTALNGDLSACQQPQAQVGLLVWDMPNTPKPLSDYPAAYYQLSNRGVASVLLAYPHNPQYNQPSNEQILARFYQYLGQGLDTDEALQLAKLEFLNQASPETASPEFWDNFRLVGNVRTFAPSPKIRIWWYFLPLGGIILIGWWAWRGLKQRRKF